MRFQYAPARTFVTPEPVLRALGVYVVRVVARGAWRLGRTLHVNVDRLELALDEEWLYDRRSQRLSWAIETWPAADWPASRLRTFVSAALLVVAARLAAAGAGLVHPADPARREGLPDIEQAFYEYDVRRQIERGERRAADPASLGDRLRAGTYVALGFATVAFLVAVALAAATS